MRRPYTLRLLVLPLLLNAACRIDPAADYQRAGQLISDRTSATQPCSPAEDEVVAARVAALLADGLSVEEAVEIALINNPGFQSLFQEIGISRAQVVQSGLLSNPVLSTVLKSPEGGGRISIDLGVSQEIVDLWQIPSRRKIAKSKLEQTIAAVGQRAIELAAETKASYYRLRARQLEEETVAASVRIVEESTGIVERQERIGAASELDLNLARAASMDVRLELIAVRRERESAEIELGRTLGLQPRDYPRQLTDPLPGTEALPDVDALVAWAATERLDLQRAEQEVAAAEDEVVRQSLLVFPSVVAGVATERPERKALPARNILADTARASIANGGLTPPSIQPRSERELARRQFIDFLIGPSFQATLPVWDQNQAQIAIAISRVRQRRQDYQDLLIRVGSEVAQGLSSLRTVHEEVEFYSRQAIPLAESNEQGGRNLFMGGAQNILVLLEAQRSLVTRRRAYVRAQGAYAAARVELERAVGGRLHSPASRPASAPGEQP